jgi:hypothetical protein
MIGLIFIFFGLCLQNLNVVQGKVMWIRGSDGEMSNEFGNKCQPQPGFFQLSPLRSSKLTFFIGNDTNVAVHGVYDSGADTSMLSRSSAKMHDDQLLCHKLIVVGANFVSGGAHFFKCIAEIVVSDVQGQSSAVLTVLVPSQGDSAFAGANGVDLFGFDAMETTYSDMSHTCSSITFRKGRFVDDYAMGIFNDALFSLNATAADLVHYSQLPMNIADSVAELANKGLTHTIAYVDIKRLGIAQFLFKH